VYERDHKLRTVIYFSFQESSVAKI